VVRAAGDGITDWAVAPRNFCVRKLAAPSPVADVPARLIKNQPRWRGARVGVGLRSPECLRYGADIFEFFCCRQRTQGRAHRW
jgi:hypothetical protein